MEHHILCFSFTVKVEVAVPLSHTNLVWPFGPLKALCELLQLIFNPNVFLGDVQYSVILRSFGNKHENQPSMTVHSSN